MRVAYINICTCIYLYLGHTRTLVIHIYFQSTLKAYSTKYYADIFSRLGSFCLTLMRVTCKTVNLHILFWNRVKHLHRIQTHHQSFIAVPCCKPIVAIKSQIIHCPGHPDKWSNNGLSGIFSHFQMVWTEEFYWQVTVPPICPFCVIYLSYIGPHHWDPTPS